MNRVRSQRAVRAGYRALRFLSCLAIVAAVTWAAFAALPLSALIAGFAHVLVVLIVYPLCPIQLPLRIKKLEKQKAGRALSFETLVGVTAGQAEWQDQHIQRSFEHPLSCPFEKNVCRYVSPS